MYAIRTDLALEAGDTCRKRTAQIRGVSVEETQDQKKNLKTTVVRIDTENASREVGKPKGTYITLESPDMAVQDEGYHAEISVEIAHHIEALLKRHKPERVLVVGLGNDQITTDALGPMVIDNLHVTRHLVREYGVNQAACEVSAIVPGVMAQTGMETCEILQGIVQETKPEVMIVLDSLAARSIKRLNCTVQMTDTGIAPGAGIGNHRRGLSEKEFGIPVIGIGVPMVVDAATIVYDAMESVLQSLDEAEQKEFLDEMLTPRLRAMYVATKDVDEQVKRLSFTLSEGINLALSHGLK